MFQSACLWRCLADNNNGWCAGVSAHSGLPACLPMLLNWAGNVTVALMTGYKTQEQVHVRWMGFWVVVQERSAVQSGVGVREAPPAGSVLAAEQAVGE
jgi:hypothetical protein